MDFNNLRGNTYHDDVNMFEVYFADNYIELIDPKTGKYVEQFPYPEVGQTVKGKDNSLTNELFLDDSSKYLEFIHEGKVLTTIDLRNPVIAEEVEENTQVPNIDENEEYKALQQVLVGYFNELKHRGIGENFIMSPNSSTKFEFDVEDKHYEIGIDLAESGGNRIYAFEPEKNDIDVNNIEDIIGFVNGGNELQNLNEWDVFNVSRRDVMNFEDYLKFEKKGGASKPIKFKDYPNHLKGYQHEIDRAENFKHPHYDYTYRSVIGSSKGRHKAGATDPKEFDSKVEGTFKPEEDKRKLPGMLGYNNGKFAVKESLDFHVLVDDIFFLWDEFFDDNREGIERGVTNGKETISFDFSKFDETEVNTFTQMLKELLNTNKMNYSLDNDILVLNNVKESLNESNTNRVFTSIDGDRKIEFHQTPSGNYEYAVMDSDIIAGEFDKPIFRPIDFEWLEEEKEAFNGDFSIFIDKIKPKVNEDSKSTEVPFEDVQPGMKGEDYAGIGGTIIATGSFEDLKQYDESGSMSEAAENLDDFGMDSDDLNMLVAVKGDDGENAVYTYGPDGFVCYSDGAPKVELEEGNTSNEIVPTFGQFAETNESMITDQDIITTYLDLIEDGQTEDQAVTITSQQLDIEESEVKEVIKSRGIIKNTDDNDETLLPEPNNIKKQIVSHPDELDETKNIKSVPTFEQFNQSKKSKK